MNEKQFREILTTCVEYPAKHSEMIHKLSKAQTSRRTTERIKTSCMYLLNILSHYPLNQREHYRLVDIACKAHPVRVQIELEILYWTMSNKMLREDV